MITVILCGGKGLRYGNNKPKGLAQIGDKPILQHVMEIYSKQGHNDFIVVLGHMCKEIENYFSSIDHDYNIEFVHIEKNMNKGGALYMAKQYIQEENFFCTYCDGVANIKLSDLLDNHIKSNNIVTITAIKPYHEFGIIVFGNNNKIIKFREKPQMNEWTNGGFFVFKKDIFDHIYCPEDNLETDVFGRLVNKEKIGGFKHFGFWNTINTQKDEETLNKKYEKYIKDGTILEWFDI